MQFIIRQLSGFFLLLGFTVLFTGCVSLNGKPVYQKEGVALEGYDAVAYFRESRAVEGNPDFSTVYQGTTWYFSREEYLDQFLNNPQQYTPQYGGYCAYAMANNLVVKSDPNAFTVKNNQLYLNYSYSVRDRWLEQVDENIRDGDQNWTEKQGKVKVQP
ncbi:YHS domain-containing (seleno)protein [Endozoicomonas arenosclerae]|uniref:YHS domain-containing (seleno)protein n=1 Tax=Endozoicomonas arenosclerae TaxID=1633495 RepID=UPI0007854106|nr:YHS domain-containing (seleno)protein [Endozoicomonas arenosclerae]